MKDKNKGDEALNLEHTTVESSGKSVAIDRDDEEMKEKLNTLFKLRLLYNSGEELWQHIGKSGGGNNSFGRVGGKDAFLRRAIFMSWHVNGMTRWAFHLNGCWMLIVKLPR